MIENNTILSIVSFPDDLFYPTSQNTIGIFIKKGTPQEKKPVLWCRATRDGFLKKKKKRLFDSEARNDLAIIKPHLQSFLTNPTISLKKIPQILQTASIDHDDEELQLLPEAYIDDKAYSKEEILNVMDELYKENLAFKVRYGEKYVG